MPPRGRTPNVRAIRGLPLDRNGSPCTGSYPDKCRRLRAPWRILLVVDDNARLAQLVRAKRFRLDNTFAHVLVHSDLVCGTGACLACVVSTKDASFTRACIHGPVFPLATLFA